MCPNGVLSSKKIKQSLEKLQTEKKKRLNHSSTCDPDFWDSVDQTVRIAAAQFRDLKGSANKYAACIRKASASEKKAIDAVLDCLELKKVEGQEEQKGSTESLEAEEEESKKKGLEALEDQSPKGDKRPILAPKIFAKVLQKRASDASTPEKRVRKKQAASSWNAVAVAGSAPAESEELKTWLEQKAVLVSKPRNKKAWKKPEANISGKANSDSPKVNKKPAVKAVKGAQKKKKSTFKHRKTSTAYHQAVNAAKNSGMDADEAKEMGRQAARKMAADIDSGLVTEAK